MPVDKKDLPLEVEDHVVLDCTLEAPCGAASLMVLAGTHGVVKHIFGKQVVVEFGSMLFGFANPKRDLTLYRRSQHSKRRA